MLDIYSFRLSEDDIEYLDTLHTQRGEAVRILIRKAKSHDLKEEFYKYLQFVTLGVVVLGISILLDPFSFMYLLMIGLGTGLAIFGIISLVLIARKRRKDNAVES